MASIVKRGKTYSVVWYEGTGKERHQVWESGLSYTAARERKAKLEYEMSTNTHVDKNNILVSDFIYEYLEKYGTKKWAASTYDGNEGLLENYIHPYLGDKKVVDITTKAIDDFYHYLMTEAVTPLNKGKPRREHVTPSTIHDIHKVMRCAFKVAKRWGYIAQNPFLDVTLPDHYKSERKILTPEQVQRVLDYTDQPNNYDYYVMHCALHMTFAGCMRGGEVGGSQWDRLKDSGEFSMDRVIDRIQIRLIDKLQKVHIYFKFPNLYSGTKTAIILKEPKTEGSIRTIYFPQPVVQKLNNLKNIQERYKSELGSDGYMDYNLIICQANGRPFMTEHLNKRFKEILLEMNDPEIDPNEIVYHSLRHTSATYKLRLSNGDLKAVQGDGGWSTSDMITKTYAHILDENRRILTQKMEDDFYTKKETPKADTISNENLTELLKNPEALIKILQAIQLPGFAVK